MDPKKFFSEPQNTVQRQYEALRSFYTQECSGKEAASKYGYTLNSFYSLARDFKKHLAKGNAASQFFTSRTTGRKLKDTSGEMNKLIIALRKKYMSVPDIKTILDVQGYQVSERYICNIIKNDGFDRLPRRTISAKEKAISSFKLDAPKSVMLDYASETFTVQNTLGVLCLLPYIQQYGIDEIIEESEYPETGEIDRISSILSFLGLKLSNVRRYTSDDAWCMDRGLGMFAGLNVLPKSSWCTSYSSRVIRKMNRSFLKKLHEKWIQYDLLSDTSNLDFTTIPYWGDDSHLENNWSGTRNKVLPSMLAVLAQDPDSGIITYGDTSIRHEDKYGVAIEFLDFYKSDDENNLRYLVFDSKFTTYENLAKLGKHVKFLTIRRRGKKIVETLNNQPTAAWKKVWVPTADGKGRTLKVIDEKIFLKDYGADIRQIAITGHGRIKPALLITNDFDKPCRDMIRKYTRRWLVEKEISEQIEFFHLNRVSSSMVIKVDFDLTMSILAHNLLRLFASDLIGYSHNSDFTLFKKFLSMSGSVEITQDTINVTLKKKRNLPALLTAMEVYRDVPLKLLGGRKLLFKGGTST